MTAGSMRERLRFEKEVQNNDDDCAREYDWQPIVTVAGRLRPLRGKELERAAYLDVEIECVAIVRYSSVTKGLTHDHRIVDTRADEIYNIESILNMDERKRFLTIYCTRRTKNQ